MSDPLCFYNYRGERHVVEIYDPTKLKAHIQRISTGFGRFSPTIHPESSNIGPMRRFELQRYSLEPINRGTTYKKYCERARVKVYTPM